jgi:hypothetical protein
MAARPSQGFAAELINATDTLPTRHGPPRTPAQPRSPVAGLHPDLRSREASATAIGPTASTNTVSSDVTGWLEAILAIESRQALQFSIATCARTRRSGRTKSTCAPCELAAQGFRMHRHLGYVGEKEVRTAALCEGARRQTEVEPERAPRAAARLASRGALHGRSERLGAARRWARVGAVRSSGSATLRVTSRARRGYVVRVRSAPVLELKALVLRPCGADRSGQGEFPHD